jgi:hypothetical protein
VETAASFEGMRDQWAFEEGHREGWCCDQARYHDCHEEQEVAAVINCGMVCVEKILSTPVRVYLLPLKLAGV